MKLPQQIPPLGWAVIAAGYVSLRILERRPSVVSVIERESCVKMIAAAMEAAEIPPEDLDGDDCIKHIEERFFNLLQELEEELK